MADYAIADIIALRDENILGLVQDTTKKFPLIEDFPAIGIPGIQYKQPVVTALPAASFRALNTGKANVAATVTYKAIDLQFIDAGIVLDVMNAMADYHGPEHAIAFAAKQALLGCWATLETQLLYGNFGGSTGAAGFDGLKFMIDSSMVINANGAISGACSDIFAVCYDDVQLAIGHDGLLIQGPATQITAFDGSGNPYQAFSQPMGAYTWLLCSGVQSAARLKNVDTTAVCTDKLLAQLYSAFKMGHQPDAFIMSRRSLQQLRDSRTAVNPTGSEAPYPSEAFGVKILVSDAVVNTLNPV